MSEVKSTVSPLAAFRLAEERACAGYLVARKAMVRLTAQVASIGLLVRQYPAWADYRKRLGELVGQQVDAEQRATLAWQCYQRAQVRADAFWAAMNKAGAPVAAAA